MLTRSARRPAPPAQGAGAVPCARLASSAGLVGCTRCSAGAAGGRRIPGRPAAAPPPGYAAGRPAVVAGCRRRRPLNPAPCARRTRSTAGDRTKAPEPPAPAMAGARCRGVGPVRPSPHPAASRHGGHRREDGHGGCLREDGRGETAFSRSMVDPPPLQPAPALAARPSTRCPPQHSLPVPCTRCPCLALAARALHSLPVPCTRCPCPAAGRGRVLMAPGKRVGPMAPRLVLSGQP
ncbi:hypothetical protein QFZ74_000058 [Streptomyces sp. V3I7]|nr:hypothetical protein [Streptomyces sp. V3I7]